MCLQFVLALWWYFQGQMFQLESQTKQLHTYCVLNVNCNSSGSTRAIGIVISFCVSASCHTLMHKSARLTCKPCLCDVTCHTIGDSCFYFRWGAVFPPSWRVIFIHVCVPDQGQGFSEGLYVWMKRDTNEAPKPFRPFLHVGRWSERGQKAADRLCASIGVRMRSEIWKQLVLYVYVWHHVKLKTCIDFCILKLKYAAREKKVSLARLHFYVIIYFVFPSVFVL